MQNLTLKPAIQAFNHDSGFARYSIPVLLSPRQGKKLAMIGSLFDWRRISERFARG